MRPARDRLVSAASELFYAHGVHATGIDTITERAGVARKSLYNNFSSKDDLVAAYITARDAEWLAHYRSRVAGADDPRDRVLAVFDAYLDHANAPYVEGFRGCGLLNAAGEFRAGSAGQQAVREHKEEVESILRGHLNRWLDDAAADRAAEHLAYLLEGAVSRAGLEGTSERLERSRHLAVTIVNAL